MSTLVHLAQVAQTAAEHSQLLADPTPTPAPTPGQPTVDVGGLQKFIVTWILPLVLTLIGIFVITRAKKGDMNATLTSFSIVVIGVVIIAGAGTLFFLGQYLVGLAIR